MTYVEGDSFVHRWDARAKIAGLFAFSIAIFFVQTWWGMAVFAGVVVALAIAARIPARQMLAPLAPVAVLAAFAAIFAFASNPTLDGLSAGLIVAVRMVALVAASFVVCLTTPATALIAAFAFFIKPLGHIGVPVDDIAFTLSLALRFIPLIVEQFELVRIAQRARGADLDGVSFMRKLEIWGAAFSAVFIGMFRRADTLASALDARCYGATRPPSR